MPRVRRVALACCFLCVCLVVMVQLPSKNLLAGILETDPQDAERIMMERYAHSLQFKGKVRIKSLNTAMEEDDRSDNILPKLLTKKERSTVVYYPPVCQTGRPHWRICKKIVPSFIIAGAEHSGANVLYEAFRTHPQVWDLVKSNEMYERISNATLLDIPDNRGTPFFGSQNYNEMDPSTKNLEWYLRYFPSIKDIPQQPHNPVLPGDALPHIQHYGLSHANSMENQETSNYNEEKIVVGECAPSYLHMDGASRRIANTMPEIKVVFIFRDPIDRAYLNYLEQKQFAGGYSFEEIVAEELLILKECIARPGSKKWTEFLKCHSEEAKITARRMGLPLRPRTPGARDPPAPLLDLIVKGLYYSQLHEFVKYVPFTKILVLRTEDLYAKSSTVSTMVRLSQFLKLDPAHFMNFPIEIGTDPMAHLRHSGLHYQNNNGIILQDELELLESSDLGNVDDDDSTNGSSSPKGQRGYGGNGGLSNGSSSLGGSGINNKPSPSDPPLELATRFRLQRIFQPFNQKLVDMFEHQQDFPGWEYDVDRG
ncbi:hypothetical protein BGW42_007234 [Actinomortierella wolfii]|nr:hypothetical protein BGW42_007234 [Actinomortierella wolfii]KAG0244927.1 hypothetical protein BGW41_005526 [Actinomortierella wolfii]